MHDSSYGDVNMTSEMNHTFVTCFPSSLEYEHNLDTIRLSVFDPIGCQIVIFPNAKTVRRFRI
jgi:hypothetical protein